MAGESDETAWSYEESNLRRKSGEHGLDFPASGGLRLEVDIHLGGDKTAIELFLGGVRGWEAGLWRKLSGGKH